MVRERAWKPPPHDFVHELHLPKAPNWQSVGQHFTLHVNASVLCGQDLPPLRGSVSTRKRVVTPLLHDLVHVVHVLHEPMPQSVGQAKVLQLRVSSRYGHV